MSSKVRVSTFIQKLWALLKNYSKQQDVICWSNSGNSFVIRNQKKFCQALLPIYFKHSNFTSFVRQLNMYNFHKVKSKEFQYEFEHQLFKRGHNELLIGIKRKPNESDLNFGKDLIKKLNLNQLGESNLQSISQIPTVALQVKSEAVLNQEIQSIDNLLIQNLNLKKQNILLKASVQQLR